MIIFHFHSKIDYCQLLLINIILMFKSTGLPLKKTLHVWLLHAKTTFYCYGVQSEIACHNTVVRD